MYSISIYNVYVMCILCIYNVYIMCIYIYIACIMWVYHVYVMYLSCISVNRMIPPVGSYPWDSLKSNTFRGQFVMANELHRKWPWDCRALWWFEVWGGVVLICRWHPLTGIIELPILGGIKQCKSMVILRDFRVNNALFGLLIHHDPCNMVENPSNYWVSERGTSSGARAAKGCVKSSPQNST